jgi:triphosphatase
MAIEIEIKLGCPARALRGVAALPLLKSLMCGQVKREQLTSIYYDTPKCELRSHGLTLRVRKVGRKMVQTIKTIANGAEGAFGRSEWETEIDRWQPKLEFAKGTPLQAFTNSRLRSALRPMFETRVLRTVLPLRVGVSEIEVSIDQGRILAGAANAPICEIELELKGGDPAALVQLAADISAVVPVFYGPLAKAERGYALLAGNSAAPVHAVDVIFDKASTPAVALSVIGLSCLRHLMANEEAVRQGIPEGIHQMRVGLRRLRAALSIFKPLTQGDEADDIELQLEWLTEQLGPARDMDVILRNGLAPLRKTNAAKRQIDLLATELSHRRDAGLKDATAAVDSDRYRKAMLRAALWLANGERMQGQPSPLAVPRNQSIVSFARNVLDHRTQKILKKTKKLKTLDARHRHKLRIAVKELRYAAEFFSCLFAKLGKDRKRFLLALEDLQESLGELNDISMHKKLAKRFAHLHREKAKRTQMAFAMAIFIGHDRVNRRSYIDAAVKAGRRFADSPPFWR